MKFLGYRFRHYSQKWLKLVEILLSVAVRLSLCALGGANVKKQASLAQLFASAVENVPKMSCRNRTQPLLYVHDCIRLSQV